MNDRTFGRMQTLLNHANTAPTKRGEKVHLRELILVIERRLTEDERTRDEAK